MSLILKKSNLKILKVTTNCKNLSTFVSAKNCRISPCKKWKNVRFFGVSAVRNADELPGLSQDLSKINFEIPEPPKPLSSADLEAIEIAKLAPKSFEELSLGWGDFSYFPFRLFGPGWAEYGLYGVHSLGLPWAFCIGGIGILAKVLTTAIFRKFELAQARDPLMRERYAKELLKHDIAIKRHLLDTTEGKSEKHHFSQMNKLDFELSHNMLGYTDPGLRMRTLLKSAIINSYFPICLFIALRAMIQGPIIGFPSEGFMWCPDLTMVDTSWAFWGLPAVCGLAVVWQTWVRRQHRLDLARTMNLPFAFQWRRPFLQRSTTSTLNLPVLVVVPSLAGGMTFLALTGGQYFGVLPSALMIYITAYTIGNSMVQSYLYVAKSRRWHSLIPHTRTEEEQRDLDVLKRDALRRYDIGGSFWNRAKEERSKKAAATFYDIRNQDRKEFLDAYGKEKDTNSRYYTPEEFEALFGKETEKPGEIGITKLDRGYYLPSVRV